MKKSSGGRCLLCGQIIKSKATGRVCHKCGRPVTRHHKYRYIKADQPGVYMLEHWDCNNPTDYGGENR